MFVSAVGRWDYEVVTKDENQFNVSLEKKTCTCLEFQKVNMPCTHAIAAVRAC